MKRFTATDKWSDKWFRKLPPASKLAYLYLLDACDSAGVLEADEELAEFQIGERVEWDSLIDGSGGRIQRIHGGRLWLSKFIGFQWGELSESCKPHLHVLRLAEKHGIDVDARVCTESAQNDDDKNKGYSKGIYTLRRRVKDKEKDKEKEQDKGGGAGEGKTKTSLRVQQVAAGDVRLPASFAARPDVVAAIADWLTFKAARGQRYTSPDYFSRKVAEFSKAGPDAFIAAVNHSIGNNYSGLFAARNGSDASRSPDPLGTRAAAAEFLAGGKNDGE